MDEDAICKSIVEKFENVGGNDVSYAEIARKAWEVGRTDLATKVRKLPHIPTRAHDTHVLATHSAAFGS